MSKVQILVADDNELLRRSLRSLIEAQSGWCVCGEASDGLEAVEKARLLRPDVVLMDMSMPRMDGLEATRAIRHELPNCKVIVVTQNDPAIARQQAISAGAQGFVPKSNLAQDLIPEINKLASDPANIAQGAGNPRAGGRADDNLFDDSSEMAALMRAKDWAGTPLGPTETWSTALRMMVRFMLPNPFPQLLWWGPQLCCLYNDAYAPVLGAKHPWALGRPTVEVWREVWHVLGPLVDAPFNGGPATWVEDIPLEVNRNGFMEETHFTIAYSPIKDDTVPSGIGGVLATVHEISQRVVGERRVVILKDLAARPAEPKSSEEACIIAAETLTRHSKDIPFALLYLIDEKQTRAYFAAGSNINTDGRRFPRTVMFGEQQSKQVWPFAAAMKNEEIQVVSDLSGKFEIMPQGPWTDAPRLAAVVPIRSNIPHQFAGFAVIGISSRLQFDESYRNFLDLVSTQISTSIANARAYEEERKRAEALAEIDRAKTAFFSNVSHEFRTPLTLMLGPLEDSLAASEGLPAEHRERLEVAHRNSGRLLRLVNNLLDFSRIEAGRIEASYEPTDLGQFTAELASVFRSAVERAGLRLVIHCSQISQQAYVDREMWEKIVLNLLSNAFKFTFDGEIEVSLTPVDGTAELSVRDTGTGIPAEEIPHLFERFHRVKGARGRTFEGSGIGLSLVQELVKLHGGTVRVESRLHEGTTFTVSIPLGRDHLPANRIGASRVLESTGLRGEAYVQEALRWLPGEENVSDLPVAQLPIGVETPELSKPVSQTAARVLIADDNADMRDYLQRLLRREYEVETVADGEAALQSALDRQPDLILSDIMMPRMDGYALLRAVRADETLRTVPVILLSARAGEEARIEGIQSGADDYLVKPFSARELLARVGSQIALAKIRRDADELNRKMRVDAELLASIVSSSDDAIISKDLNGTITSWNKSAERMYGYTAEEVIGQNIMLVIPSDRRDEEVRILASLREGNQIDHFQTVRLRKDGTALDVSLTISPIRDAAGRVIGASKVARDITTEKRAQQDLRESEERYRRLAETLEAEVRVRTGELEERNSDVLRQSEQLRRLSQNLLNAQDEERRHLARELHDSAGQTLTVLGLSLAQMTEDARNIAPELGKQAEGIQELVQQLHQDIRTTSYLLHPPLLDEAGLSSALNWYVQGLVERSGLELSLIVPDDFGRLPREMELVVFRLVQECLTNIHRHSGSKTASIKVARDSDQVTIDVQDQGRGMSPQRLVEIQSGGSGVGIRGMRERLRQFEGKLTIESDSGGTQVSVTIPVRKTSLEEASNTPERSPTAV